MLHNISRTPARPRRPVTAGYRLLLIFILLDLLGACFYAVAPDWLNGSAGQLLGGALVSLHLLVVAWAQRYGLRRHNHLLYPLLVSSLVLLGGVIRHFFF